MKKTKKDYRSTDFRISAYSTGTLKPKGLPFAKLYFSKNVAAKYALAALAGVIFAVLSLFLLKNTGGFSYGLGALLQGLSRLISYLIYASHAVDKSTAALLYSLLFWGLLLVFNIPLFIFSWKKIGHRFTLLSLTFIAVDVGVGLALDQIPGIANINLLGDTNLYVNQTYNAQWIKDMKELGVKIVPFTVPSNLIDSYHPANYIKSFLLILYGLVYALFAGVVFAMLYIVGGCTSGSDFVSTYLAIKKKKDIGIVFLIINILCVTLGVVLGCFIPAVLVNKDCASVEFFLSSNYISTLLSLALFTIMFKIFYPRSKKFRVEVFSNKTNKIRDALYKNYYVHASSIDHVQGGYSKKKQTRFMTICSTMELPMLLDQINRIDDNATISVTKLTLLAGPFASQQLGSDGAVK